MWTDIQVNVCVDHVHASTDLLQKLRGADSDAESIARRQQLTSKLYLPK